METATFYTVHNPRTGISATRVLPDHTSKGDWFRARPYHVSDIITVVKSTTVRYWALTTPKHIHTTDIAFVVDSDGSIW